MSIWQTPSWGKFLVSSGQAQEVFEVSGIHLEKRCVFLGQFGLFALGVKNSPNPFIKGELEQLCKKHNCLFVQIETLNYTSLQASPVGEEVKWGQAWKPWYYKKFITPHTAIIDLTRSEENILAQMKPKGRYNIRLAEKKAIEVIYSDNSSADIQSFYTLMQETTQRDSFSGNTQQYYTKLLQQIPDAQLLFAKKDDTIIAAGIFVFSSDVSLYYYGASTSAPRYRNMMAPYLLQWEAIKRAKQCGSQYYDFLWVSAPDELWWSLAGVTSFKKKLTSDIRHVSESEIFIAQKIKYFLLQILRSIRK